MHFFRNRSPNLQNKNLPALRFMVCRLIIETKIVLTSLQVQMIRRLILWMAPAEPLSGAKLVNQPSRLVMLMLKRVQATVTWAYENVTTKQKINLISMFQIISTSPKGLNINQVGCKYPLIVPLENKTNVCFRF